MRNARFLASFLCALALTRPLHAAPAAPVAPPTVASVEATMARVCDHLNTTQTLAVTDRVTKAPLADWTTPNPNATVRIGGYPMGVLLGGMILAAQVTGDKRYTDFTTLRLQFLHDRLPYFQSLTSIPNAPHNALADFIAPTSLDECGAWGAALIKARRAGLGPDLLPIINLEADWIQHKQYRLPDGTLARHEPWENTVWGDDMYMSIPFLAQMGALTHDKAYTDDAIRQARQTSARLFDPTTHLYHHGWTLNDPPDTPRYYWGRVNGWCLMSLIELLDTLPANDPARPGLLQILRDHAAALKSLQAPDGLWHQILDKPETWEETSCTAMFTFAFARAINRGWLSAADYAPTVLRGWNGLLTQITPAGAVENTCIGTSYSHDLAYYLARPHRDDLHGYGPVLFAGAELVTLLQNKRVKLSSTLLQTPPAGVTILTARG